METRKLYYLAAPYAHPDPLVKRWRLKTVNLTAGRLMQKGQWVFSPLTHNALLDQYGVFGDWSTWGDYDLEMVARCDALLVLKLPGWEESKGVQGEIKQARKLEKEILYLDPPEDEIYNPECALFSKHLNEFFKDREWDSFHAPKNLAMNLAVEIGEILEHFRWLALDEEPEDKKGLSHEIADAFTMLLHLANKMGIDLLDASYEKLKKNAERYPADLCKGIAKKYTAYE